MTGEYYFAQKEISTTSEILPLKSQKKPSKFIHIYKEPNEYRNLRVSMGDITCINEFSSKTTTGITKLNNSYVVNEKKTEKDHDEMDG